MQSFFMIFAIIYVVQLSSGWGQETPTTPSPISCDAYGNITYTAPKWVKSASYLCGTEASRKTAEINSNSIILRGCPIGSTVHLIMYNMASVLINNITILSAQGQNMTDAHLTCNGLTSARTFTVRLDSQIGSTQKPLSATESITLKMELTYNNATPAKTVEIGQTYKLHVSGAGTHNMTFKTCEAAATHDMAQAVTIYDSNDVESAGVLTNIIPDTPTPQDMYPIKATLTGFRLVTSRIVFLSCQIQVCVSDCMPKKRKMIKSQLKTASIMFEVKNKWLERSANGAKGLFSTGKHILTIAMVVVTTYLFH